MYNCFRRTIILSLSPTNSIIIFGISFYDYSFNSLIFNWKEYNFRCPACRYKHFNIHGNYTKYYYEHRVKVLRLKCMLCTITHSLIPSFSVPNRSIGTEDLEKYIKKLEDGASKYGAAKIFDSLAVSENYTIQLNKSIEQYFIRAKAFFPDTGNHLKNKYE